MAQSLKPQPNLNEISNWLSKRHGRTIDDVTPLAGGFWSAAYGYQLGSDDLVLRFNETAEGFNIDQAAMKFTRPGLPIPKVLETGEALGLNYAISVRHYGRFLETTQAIEGPVVGQALSALLTALREVQGSTNDSAVWYAEHDSPKMSWHEWILGGLVDNSENPVNSWRAKIAAIPHVDQIFRRSDARIRELLAHCPERRDLIHGDLLHQNVLVSEDASEVTGIFSWKCSALGDFLYDVAWCTFWSDWHPGIAAADILDRTLSASDLTPDDLADAELRHHCYELQIGATHLGMERLDRQPRGFGNSGEDAGTQVEKIEIEKEKEIEIESLWSRDSAYGVLKDG